MIETTQEKLNPREGDETIDCKVEDCEVVIIFTKRDQDFFASKGFSRPGKCKKHREEFKKSRGNF